MYLGIDLGTSELKVVLLDAGQRLVATARHELTVQRPHPLWSEQDPAAWWQAVEAAMVEMLAASGQWIRAALTSGEIAQLTQLLDRLVAAPERGEPPA